VSRRQRGSSDIFEAKTNSCGVSHDRQEQVRLSITSSLCMCAMAFLLQVTAISDSEEVAMGRADLVPFLVEDRIREVCTAPADG